MQEHTDFYENQEDDEWIPIQGIPINKIADRIILRTTDGSEGILEISKEYCRISVNSIEVRIGSPVKILREPVAEKKQPNEVDFCEGWGSRCTGRIEICCTNTPTIVGNCTGPWSCPKMH